MKHFSFTAWKHVCLSCVALMCSAGGHASAASLHIFQTKPGNQIYTTFGTVKGVEVRGDMLYYRQNTNLNGRVVFDARTYGKGSVLLNATLGKPGEVYVLANIVRGEHSESTIFRINLTTKAVLAKVSLQAMGLENVSPANFIYDHAAQAVKVTASKGYVTHNGVPSANYATFWISVANTPKIVKSVQQNS